MSPYEVTEVLRMGSRGASFRQVYHRCRTMDQRAHVFDVLEVDLGNFGPFGLFDGLARLVKMGSNCDVWKPGKSVGRQLNRFVQDPQSRLRAKILGDRPGVRTSV